MTVAQLNAVSTVTPSPDWLDALRGAVGAAMIETDAGELAFFAQDVFSLGRPLSVVVKPHDVAGVQAAVKSLVENGVAVIPRGGGLSYTDGFLAAQTPSALLDLGKLDRLVELNLEDRYVTVETGMTWGALDVILAPHGLRTPYWGPLSGLRSTVGGALSQNSIFLGSGTNGSAGDSLLCLEVVLADGSIARTGSAAAAHSSPFFRYFGPDLSGLFIGDAGALGIKVRATFRLIPRPTEIDFLSYEYSDPLPMLAAMSDVSRQGLASECFSFDPVLTEQRKKRMSLFADAKTLFQVVKQSGLKAGLGLVSAGRDFISEGKYSAHVVIEGDSKASVAARIERAKAALAKGGVQTENSFPKALRALPFVAPNAMLGPAGERWVPVHGIFPHSKTAGAFSALEKLFSDRRETLVQHQIRVGFLCSTILTQATLIEPVFYWPDKHNEYHKRMVEADYLKRCGEPDANPAATAAVAALKRDVADLMRDLGGTHFQIGKFYRYRDGRDPVSLALFDTIKRTLDPKGLMNPGVLQ